MSGVLKGTGSFIPKHELIPSSAAALHVASGGPEAMSHRSGSNPQIAHGHFQLGQCYVEPWIPRIELEHQTKLLRWTLAKSFDDESVFNCFFANAFATAGHHTSTQPSASSLEEGGPAPQVLSRGSTVDASSAFLALPQLHKLHHSTERASHTFALAIFDQFLPLHGRVTLNGIAMDMKASVTANFEMDSLENATTSSDGGDTGAQLQFHSLVKKYSVRLIFLTLYYLSHQDVSLRSKYAETSRCIFVIVLLCFCICGYLSSILSPIFFSIYSLAGPSM
jgi:hypothetical protein